MPVLNYHNAHFHILQGLLYCFLLLTKGLLDIFYRKGGHINDKNNTQEQQRI